MTRVYIALPHTQLERARVEALVDAERENTALRTENATLKAEVERLRGEVSLLQQEARIGRNISNGLAADVATERAAVVAWLRGQLNREVVLSKYEQRLLGFACRRIERGEHRREEER